MQFTSGQVKAIEAIAAWHRSSWKQTFTLAGYAGTGKTTLLQHFINTQNNVVTCLAPTGKAASVLQKKLDNAMVSTVHRVLYNPSPPSTSNLDALEASLVNNPNDEDLKQAILDERRRLAGQNLNFNKKIDCEIGAGQLVVVDEASMVTRRMRKDLEETGAKILFVGDPGQLPPVQDEGFFQHSPPDAMLTEVQRQALDSPIIRVSMEVREGKAINAQREDGPFRKMPKNELSHEEWLTFDQVITGTNEARRKINRYFRGKLGKNSWWPETGDKIICLKNSNDNGIYYINGVQGKALSNAKNNADFDEIIGEVLYEGTIRNVMYYRYPFQVHYDANAIELQWYERAGLQEFDYAYAITVHKSQGSEWDRVLLADDGMNANQKEFRKRWLYTAVTRAKEELVWLF